MARRRAERPMYRSVLSPLRSAYSRQLRVTTTSIVLELGNSRTASPPQGSLRGRKNASGWRGGRRQRSSQWAYGHNATRNGVDMVKDCQGRRGESQVNGLGVESR